MIEFTWHCDEKGYDGLLDSSLIAGEGQKLYGPPRRIPDIVQSFREHSETAGRDTRVYREIPLSLDGAAGGKGEKLFTVIE